MRLMSIMVLRTDFAAGAEPFVLADATDVSHVGYFARSGAAEFITFIATTVAKRTQPGSRVQVNEQGHTLYAHSFGKYCVTVACDKEYPSRVAFTLAASVGRDFTDKFRGRWETTDKKLDWPELMLALKQFQNPQQADPIMRIAAQIDETKIVMCEALDQVLLRGERIDELVSRSQILSEASKDMFTNSKRLNSWCCIIQ